MSNYANGALAPRTLTEREQAILLKVTGEHRRGFRNHVIFAVALTTALREHEIAGLDNRDVYDEAGRPRRRVQLRVFKRSNSDRTSQELILPERLREKLKKFRTWKEQRGESLAPDAPLFQSQKRNRISLRQLRTLVHVWQTRAGFDRHIGFHGLRHTSCTALYRVTKDIRLTQRFARHKSLASTTRYTHASDDELALGVNALTC